MEHLLEQKIALEHLWIKLYKQDGVYTNKMAYIDESLKEIRKKIIVQDIKMTKQKLHNQMTD